jgi:hypothetical protein
MRSFIMSIIILVLLITGVWLQHIMLDKKLDMEVANFSRVEHALFRDDFDSAQKEFSKSLASFEKNREIYYMLVDHLELDSAEMHIKSLGAYIYQNEKEDSINACVEIRFYLTHIMDRLEFSFPNIL